MVRGDYQHYVVELFEELLGPSRREARFSWALGDRSHRTGRRVALPFDAVWEERRLILEVNESQHFEPSRLFDKPSVITVSGVHRGEQRTIYDLRKRRAAHAQGYQVIDVTPEQFASSPGKRPRLLFHREHDLRVVESILAQLGVPYARPYLEGDSTGS